MNDGDREKKKAKAREQRIINYTFVISCNFFLSKKPQEVEAKPQNFI